MAKFTFEGIRVAGMSCVVPKKVVKTESYKEVFGENEVDKFMAMTGITQTRRASHFQTGTDLGYTAAKRILDHKNIDASEIGGLIYVTHSPDYRRPASAFVLQKRLGLSTESVVYDISLGCSSAVYGVQAISAMLSNSDIDKALLVLGDTVSKTTNPRDRASQMLVGDGAVALLFEKKSDASKIQGLYRSDGEGFKYLIVPGGGYRYLDAPDTEEISNDGNPRSLNNSFMDGTSVFTFTISDVPKAIKDYWSWTDTSPDDYDAFAFHQANGLILKKIARKLRIPEEKMPITLPTYGNTSGASSILTLCNEFGDLQEGKIKAMVVGFGIGISWGVTSLELNVEDILPITEDDSIFEEGLFRSVKDLG